MKLLEFVFILSSHVEGAGMKADAKFRVELTNLALFRLKWIKECLFIISFL